MQLTKAVELALFYLRRWDDDLGGDLALRLEQIGRSGSLDGAAEVWAELPPALDELGSLLGEFTEPAVP